MKMVSLKETQNNFPQVGQGTLLGRLMLHVSDRMAFSFQLALVQENVREAMLEH